MKSGYIYIITNQNNTTLYIGVTSDIHKRIKQHQNNIYPNSFSAQYKLTKLVYFEAFLSIEDAIAREKQLKAGSRQNKTELINQFNPTWKDLYWDLESLL